MTPPSESRRSRSTSNSGEVALGAVNAHGVQAVRGEGFAEVQLGERCLHERRPLLVLEPGQLVEQQARGLELALHLDDAVRDRLERCRWAGRTGCALLRVADRVVELARHGTHMAREDEAALPFHRVAEDAGAAAFGAEPILLRARSSPRARRRPGDWSSGPSSAGPASPCSRREPLSTRNAERPQRPTAGLVVAKTRQSPASGERPI